MPGLPGLGGKPSPSEPGREGAELFRTRLGGGLEPQNPAGRKAGASEPGQGRREGSAHIP